MVMHHQCRPQRTAGVRLDRADPYSDSIPTIGSRSESKRAMATLEEGRWLFKSARRYFLDGPPVDQDSSILRPA